MKIRRLLPLLVAALATCVVVAAAAAQDSPPPDAPRRVAPPRRVATDAAAKDGPAKPEAGAQLRRIARVAGTDVNVRAGPGTAFPDLERLPRDQLVELLDVQDDWAKVRVPGGVPVYVFAELVEHEEGALRGRVTATNVLVRGTAARAHLPLHDQRLPRGEELIVLAREEADDGLWLRVLLPERMHVWMYGKYVHELDLSDDAERAALEKTLVASGRARQDASTDGRTRKEREERLQRRIVAFETELDLLRGEATTDRAVEAHALRAEKLAQDAPSESLREAALALARTARERERARVEAELDRIAREQAAADAAEQARRQAEERRLAEEKARVEAARKAREATGLIVIRNGRVILYADGRALMRLKSARFRLVDYANKRVRVEGKRVEPRGADPVFDVEHIEVLRAK